MADGNSTHQGLIQELGPINKAVKAITDRLSPYISEKSIKVPCRRLDKVLNNIDENTGDWRSGYDNGPQSIILVATEKDKRLIPFSPVTPYLVSGTDGVSMLEGRIGRAVSAVRVA